ncbi:MAG: type 3-dehydroquinate dehydratase [Bacteroidota bacterium]|jgi:3-dehydroquinate dehydratase-2
MKIAIINGPNLNLLGSRETGIYGTRSFDSWFDEMKERYPDHSFTYFQSNIEGELINAIQAAGLDQDGIVLNPAGYSHTSVAIADAVGAIRVPVVEVHISNIHAREEFRKYSLVSAKAVGCIAGLGLEGYRLAIEWLLDPHAP